MCMDLSTDELDDGLLVVEAIDGPLDRDVHRRLPRW